jgi:hypothetical protein
MKKCKSLQMLKVNTMVCFILWTGDVEYD